MSRRYKYFFVLLEEALNLGLKTRVVDGIPELKLPDKAIDVLGVWVDTPQLVAYNNRGREAIVCQVYTDQAAELLRDTLNKHTVDSKQKHEIRIVRAVAIFYEKELEGFIQVRKQEQNEVRNTLQASQDRKDPVLANQQLRQPDNKGVRAIGNNSTYHSPRRMHG